MMIMKFAVLGTAMLLASSAVAQGPGSGSSTPPGEQVALAPSPLTGTWRQSGDCSGTKAYPADFLIKGTLTTGYLAGTYKIGCINAGGDFSAGSGKAFAKPTADGGLHVVIGSATYVVNPLGKGDLRTANNNFPLDMSRQ